MLRPGRPENHRVITVSSGSVRRIASPHALGIFGLHSHRTAARQSAGIGDGNGQRSWGSISHWRHQDRNANIERFAKRAGAREGRITSDSSFGHWKNLGIFHADVPRHRFRPIPYNPYCDVRTYRAFKSSFVVIWLIRLNAGEPHL